ncbi:Mss4-like protein [Lentinula raphanica]|nr:Mss4-like protein [Lentinula raphanica]
MDTPTALLSPGLIISLYLEYLPPLSYLSRMPLELKGSCHCGAVRFTLESSTPVPYQLCFCSICRKVGGTGGSVNLGGHSDTLKILQGKEYISIYQAVLDRDTPNEKIATSERNFCSKCSSMLWLYDKTWPELIHPFASAIDSPDLEPPETMVCIKLDSKPEYVRLPEGKKETYDGYGKHSLESWHKANKLYIA